jgi:hypothetical protein
MKKLLSSLIAIAVLNLLFVSCEQQEKDTPPELPPLESMVIDFDDFTESDSKTAINDFKSASEGTTKNFEFAAGQVGFWNTILTITLAVPVASFYSSFGQKPVFLGDATWQWSYTVDGFASSYTARLTGQIRDENIKWEMFISKKGVGAFDEFKWYEGTSDLDGNGGQWMLYHSHEFPEELLQIDWKKTGTEVGEITYTIVRELNDNREPEVFNGSYLEAGKLEGDLDAYYNIHYYEVWVVKDFVDVFIEWSTSEYNGHVKAQHKFGDDLWHCWNSNGDDVACEN